MTDECVDKAGHKWVEIADSQERYGAIVYICPKCGAVDERGEMNVSK